MNQLTVHYVDQPTLSQLIPVHSVEDIPPEYRNTPVGLLLEYHNLSRPIDNSCYVHAEILIGKCMDYREKLRIPDQFAYIMRAGGANLRYNEFQISFAVAVGGLPAIALIGHTNCGMANLTSKKEKFIDGLVERAGWNRERAEEHFMHFAPMYEIDNEIDFIVSETKRLRQRYPKSLVAPMLYRIEDSLLYLLKEA